MVIQTLPKTVITEWGILSSPSEYYKAFILRKTRQTVVLLTEVLDAGFRGQMYTSRPYEVFDRVNKSLWRTLKETPMNTGNIIGCSIELPQNPPLQMPFMYCHQTGTVSHQS